MSSETLTPTKRLELNERVGGKAIEVQITGTLEQEDYDIFTPAFERLVEEHGEIRVLFRLQDFTGWSAGALWEDVRLAFRHFADIERLAIVGEKEWERGMATFCKPFTRAEVRFFESDRLGDARRWLLT